MLFEIKSGASSHDVFEGVGQLHIYEQLLRANQGAAAYRKVLVIPKGLREPLSAPLKTLDVIVLEYERKKRKVVFDDGVLNAVLKA